jgi:hypothetical protein
MLVEGVQGDGTRPSPWKSSVGFGQVGSFVGLTGNYPARKDRTFIV